MRNFNSHLTKFLANKKKSELRTLYEVLYASGLRNCECKRVLTIRPHCPECGSTNTYGKSSLSVQREYNGEAIIDRGFRCRSCGKDFHESDKCKNAPIKHGNEPVIPENNLSRERIEELDSLRREGKISWEETLRERFKF